MSACLSENECLKIENPNKSGFRARTLCLNQMAGAFCKELVISTGSEKYGGLRYASKLENVMQDARIACGCGISFASVWRVFKR